MNEPNRRHPLGMYEELIEPTAEELRRLFKEGREVIASRDGLSFWVAPRPGDAPEA